MRRRFILFPAALAAALLAFAATIPFWLGPILAVFGPPRGVNVGAYSRLGYSRFELRDVEVVRPGVKVTAARAEADTPILWLWRHWRRQDAPVIAERWRVEVDPAARRSPGAAVRSDGGWIPLRARLQRIAEELDRWLPRAQTGSGVVRWPGGELSIAAAQWSERTLTVEDLHFFGLRTRGQLMFPAGSDLLRLVLEGEDSKGASLESRGAMVTGNALWWGQDAAVAARFESSGWLPAEASLTADDVALPGGRLRLGDHYAVVRGRGRIVWDGNAFAAELQAAGEPVQEGKAPPLELDLRGRGEGHMFTVEALHATLPGVMVRLSEPVTVARDGSFRDTAARLSLAVNLADQPWLTGTGMLEGEVSVVSGVARPPVAEFTVRARDVSAQDVAVGAFAARGVFEWPRLQVTAGSLTGSGGEQIAWRGGVDLRAREVYDFAVQGQLRRSSIARWLPAQPDFDVVDVEARASGPFETVEHSGRADAARVVVPGVNPLAVVVEWRGRGSTIQGFSGEATAGATRLRAAGAVDPQGLRLQDLELARENVPLLRLTEPAALRWQPRFTLESFHLAGGDARLDGALSWGETGRIELAARNIPSSWLADLAPPSGPPWRLNLLAVIGTWDRGPMVLSVTGGAAVDLGGGRSAAVNFAARGDKDGLRIEGLRATENDVTVVNATGRLPLTVQPGTKDLLRVDTNGPLAVDAKAVPNSAFWQKLSTASGFELSDPEATLHVRGTWRRPEGTAQLRATRVALDPKRFKRELPAFDFIDVQVTADPGGVNLDRFSLKVEGQPVRARGRLPVPDDGWADFVRNPMANAERGADVHLEIVDAEVAVFTRFLPAVLAPKGRLYVNLGYKAGVLDGFLRLRDAASRPLGPLGVLQEITADVELSGRRLILRSVAAKTGGQPVALTGEVEMRENGSPRYNLSLRGENLPFVRQTGLLLRGDLDLKLQTPAENAAPRISGLVRLRDSLFLQDVRAFLPSGGSVGARRPPYFSVETPPVNAWSLAVDVVGDDFLRVRMPVFTGLASARFRLGGTLGEPRAVGEITLDEGRVRMPFASFEVKQGSIRLTESEPYHPTVYLRGTGRRFGYDLTVEIEGAGPSPNVEFSSSPALDSEQVLLMITAGVVPSNEIAFSGAQRVAHLGAFLGQSLLGSLGGDTANAERLTIASGEKISRQGKETYDIEYRLTDRWTVTGEYNEFDEFNAGLKWRMSPRKPDAQQGRAHARK
jgi:translocation and assembly module TamB